MQSVEAVLDAVRSMPPITKRGTARKVEAHGMSRSPEYSTWRAIQERCHNENNPDYKMYGGRGIRVCDEWRESFCAFYAHIGPRPSALHSIDRWPDCKGNYEPGNVRWATRRQQQQNMRNNVYFTHNGETLCASEWARRTGIDDKTIAKRIRSGATAEAVFAKVIKRPPELRGVSFNRRIGKWSAYTPSPRRHLGYFATQDEAIQCVTVARQAAEVSR